MKTIKVRILVSVDTDGHWIAVGGSQFSVDPETFDTGEHDGESRCWITAEIPVARPGAFEIPGVVE